MVQRQDEGVREAVERQRDEDPALYDYITGLEESLERHRRAAASQRKATGWLTRALIGVFLGGDLAGRTRDFTLALESWLAGDPEGPRGFPHTEAGQMGAAAFSRFMRVSVIGLVVAALPTSVLVVQTALMSEQNRTIQKQLDLQANETRLARRAQLVSILYDPVQGCDATAEPQRGPPAASRKARGEAVRVLTEIAREARQAAKASGVLSVERDADLSGVDLRQVDLVRVNFRGVNLAEAQLKGAYLTEASLSGVRLEGADLTNARLSGADLSGAQLSGARLYEALASSANLSGAQLSKANLGESDLTKANLSGADLTAAVLTGADLFEARLSKALLSETNLQNSRLEDADLSGARFRGANLTGAELPGARLTGATFDRLTTRPAGFDPVKAGARLIK